MEHISEIELIEYAAGRLDGPRNKEIAEHLQACHACSAHYRQAADTWGGLGWWQVDTSEHNVADRIIELAAKGEEISKMRHVFRMRFVSVAVRVAASIIIAIGLGHKLGEYTVAGSTPDGKQSERRPEYIAAIGLEWSSDLAWLVLEDETAEEGEQG